MYAMADENDMEDEVEEQEEEYSDSLRAQPRFGPFLTIAVAILLLFGAASRVGKKNDDRGWLGIDKIAERGLEQESVRREEERNRTIMTLGNKVAVQDSRAPATGGRLDLNDRVRPPSRLDNGLGMGGGYMPPMPMAPTAAPMNMDDYDAFSEGDAGGNYFDPAPEAAPQPRAGNFYVVKTNDNWIKIGKKTGHNWRDIEKINPESRDGLRVGMRLTLPGG